MKTHVTLIKVLILSASISAVNTGCGDNKSSNENQEQMDLGDTIKTASGLKYIITKKGDGAKAENGKMVKVHYTGKLESGQVFDSSRGRGPISFELGKPGMIPGFAEGIGYLKVGDQATLVLPPGLAYGSQGAGGVIPPNATLTFDVELMEVKDVPKPVAYDIEGKKVQKTAEGLEYIVVSANPAGKKAEKGDTVEVNYTGYLENGKIFDSSIPREETFRFPLGAGRVIAGWDIGLALMRKGEKYRLIIPAGLGYGSSPAGEIPPNSTLIFDVELVDIH